jgi:hypothetical protein
MNIASLTPQKQQLVAGGDAIHLAVPQLAKESVKPRGLK